MNVLYIALGGALGSVARYFMSDLGQGWIKGDFPVGTFTVNILGSLLIGFLWGMSGSFNYSESSRLFIFTGFLGGFTTFSTFALDGLQLMRLGQNRLAFIYMLGSLLAGLAAVFSGFWLSTVAKS